MESAISGGGGEASASSAGVPGSFGEGGGSSSSSTPERSAPSGESAPRERAAGEAKPETEEPAEPKWYREKTKIKRGGQERELTIKEALAQLSDDYEHEVTVSGATRKAKHADILRGYQKSAGAEDLMRKASEAQRTIAEQIEFAKKDPAWALESILGIEDHREWAKQVVMQLYNEEKELDALIEKDPSAYHQRMQQRVKADFERKQSFEASKRQREEQAAKARAAREQAQAKALELLKANRLSPAQLNRVGEVLNKYQQYGHQVSIEEAVAEVRDGYQAETLAWLDSHSDEELLSLLGDARRKRLRELELAKVGTRKPAAKEPEEGERRTRRDEPKQISEAQFMNRFAK